MAVGIALLAALASLQWHRLVRGQNDFVQLYIGAKLVGTPDLYSRAANQALMKSILGATMESVTYVRAPFYAVLLKPLAFLPYLAAYAVFCVLGIASILWFVVRFSRECPALPFYTSFCIPVSACFVEGQDTPFLLVFLGASILLVRRKRDFLAGLVLSLCAIKFHLFLFVLLLLIAKKRWRILAGGAAGAGVLLALSVVAAGADSISRWVATLRDPWINFSASMMPNIHGLVVTLHGGMALEVGLVVAVLLIFAVACSRSDDFEFLFALSLLCGLLVSYHSGIADDILLLPTFAFLVTSAYKPLRIALAIVLTPVPYFMMLPLSVVFPLMLLLVLALAVQSLRRPSRPLVCVAQ
jgi:Glycosyltransferase family 87